MPKIFAQNFENFKGLSYRSSHLTRPPNYAVEAKNIRIKKPYNITAETGFKIKAQPKVMYGIHNYVYQDSQGVVREELIGVNETLWKLSNATLDFNYSVPVPLSGSYSHLVQDEDYFEFSLSLTFPLGSSTVNVLTGTGIGSTNLYQLKQAIEAWENTLSITVPISGIVDGDQTNVGQLGSPITVAAGHTFQAGQWVELTTDASGVGVYRYLTEVTATTIAWSRGALIDVTDGQTLGHYNYPAAILPITESTSISLTNPMMQIAYNYWDPVSTGSFSSQPLFDSFYQTKKGGSLSYPLDGLDLDDPLEVPNASFVNAQNVCFIALGGTQQICKYDGNSCYKAGLPSPDAGYGVGIGPGLTTSGTGLTGTYKYKISYINKDNRDRITESVTSAESSITLTNQGVSITIEPINPGVADDIGYNEGCAKVNGTQGVVNGITVDVDHKMRVGDTAYFYDTSSAEYVERLVIAVTSTTITLDGAAVSVADNSIISANLRVAIYRTLADGISEFFLVAELPHNSIDNSSVYIDNAADGALGAQYIEPDPVTKLNHVPPFAKYICMHGRNLVAAEGFSPIGGGGNQYLPDATQFTNTIAWSDSVGGLEAWPLVNQERNFGNSDGAITGIASDIDDILLVFKEDAIYTVVGEIDANLYTIPEIVKGNYGASSHNSIQKVSVVTEQGQVLKMTAALGKHGICFLYGGQLVRGPVMEIKGLFDSIKNAGQTSDYLYRLSESSFNPDSGQYVVSLPRIDGSAFEAGSDLLVFDVEEGIWTRCNYDDDLALFSGSGVNYYGGIATHAEVFHFVSHYDGDVDGEHSSILFARHHPSLGANAYSANTKKITQDFIPQWDTGGEPAIKKEWKQLTIYSFQTEAEFIPFDLRVRTYRNWEDYASATPSTDYTINFTSHTQVEEFFNLTAADNAKSMLFRFTVAAVNQCINITGYEYVVSFPMAKSQMRA